MIRLIYDENSLVLVIVLVTSLRSVNVTLAETRQTDGKGTHSTGTALSQCSTAVRTVVRATQQVNGKWPFSGCQNSVTPEPID